MKVIIKVVMLLAVSAVILLTGCATSRSVLSVNQSDTEIVTQQTGKQVFINSVSDQRVFQENPKTQDIPSLGFGGAESATVAIKKRAIGRKRNGFGKALGDILLEENQTVETVMRNTLKQSFAGIGYSVVDDEDSIDRNTLMVDAEIEKFWAYMTPGFWAITLTADISTKLTLTNNGVNGTTMKEISVKSEGKYQMGTESNWIEIIDKALGEYRNKAKRVLSSEINVVQ